MCVACEFIADLVKVDGIDGVFHLVFEIFCYIGVCL